MCHVVYIFYFIPEALRVLPVMCNPSCHGYSSSDPRERIEICVLCIHILLYSLASNDNHEHYTSKNEQAFHSTEYSASEHHRRPQNEAPGICYVSEGLGALSTSNPFQFITQNVLRRSKSACRMLTDVWTSRTPNRWKFITRRDKHLPQQKTLR